MLFNRSLPVLSMGAMIAVLASGAAFAESGPGLERWWDRPLTMAAVGDSISTGFDSLYPLDNPSLSWSTGHRVSGGIRSHYARLRDLFDRPVTRHNAAVPGAKAALLASELESLPLSKLDYVTVLIGANDVCDWGSSYDQDLAQFQQDVRSAVDTVIAASPAVKILLVPVPNLLTIYEVGAKSRACREKWKLLRFCDALLAPDRSDADRLAFKGRLDDLNSALGEVASERSTHVFFDAPLANYEFTAEEVSTVDCFHPSAAGQELISELTWPGSWISQ